MLGKFMKTYCKARFETFVPPYILNLGSNPVVEVRSLTWASNTGSILKD
jgi:hypothetical protein